MERSKHCNDQPATASCGIAVVGQGFGGGPTKTQLVRRSLRRGGGAQHRLPSGHRRQCSAGRVSRRDRRLCCIRAARLRGFFSPHPAANHRLDRRLLTRRLPLVHLSRASVREAISRPSCSIPTARLADGAAGRDCGSAGPTRRTRRARPVGATADTTCSASKRVHRRLFEDVAWSTDAWRSRRGERAREIGLEVHMLPAGYDVDDAEALRILRSECSARAVAKR